MDLTPKIPAGRQVVNAYGDGGFRVAGTVYKGSILVLPDRTLAWNVGAFADMSLDSLAPVAQSDPPTELLLIGCGRSMALVPPPIRAALRARGIVIDALDTGAACRTYNVLLGEGRRVAAALIAV